jgi:hypothetical protein
MATAKDCEAIDRRAGRRTMGSSTYTLDMMGDVDEKNRAELKAVDR